MATKTISVGEDAYNELLKRKKSGESFSEELLRLAREKGRISECAGLWSWMKESDIKTIENSIEKRRAASRAAKKEKMIV